MREKILTVTPKDCVIQTFRVSGSGGTHKDKKDTGVRIIHPPSGARGESREYRRQIENKRAAFVKMANDPRFKTWAEMISDPKRIERKVDELMQPQNLDIEYGPFNEKCT